MRIRETYFSCESTTAVRSFTHEGPPILANSLGLGSSGRIFLKTGWRSKTDSNCWSAFKVHSDQVRREPATYMQPQRLINDSNPTKVLQTMRKKQRSA